MLMTGQSKNWDTANVYLLPLLDGFFFYFKTADTFGADFYLTINNRSIEKKVSFKCCSIYQAENLSSGA